MFAASTRAVRVATLPKRRVVGVRASIRMRFFSCFVAVANRVGIAAASVEPHGTVGRTDDVTRDGGGERGGWDETSPARTARARTTRANAVRNE